jgi:hypothetical protein
MRSFIVDFWSKFFVALRWLSLTHILESKFPALRRNFRLIDIYLLVNLASSVTALTVSNGIRLQWLKTLLLAWGVYRTFETVVHQTNVVLFDPYRTRRNGREYHVCSIERLVILAVQNYFEVVFWFAVIYRNCADIDLHTFWESLHASLATMTLLGSDEISSAGTEGLILSTLQTTIGFFMALVIISRFTALLPNVQQVANQVDLLEENACSNCMNDSGNRGCSEETSSSGCTR